MRSLLLILVSLLEVSFSYAAVKAPTTPELDVLTYEARSTYKDGTTVLKKPKAYDYYFGAGTRGDSAENARVVCKMIGMEALNHHVTTLEGDLLTIHYTIDQQGQISEPAFIWSGNQYTSVLSKVLCKSSK